MIVARAQELTALIGRRALLRVHVDKLDAFQGRDQKLAALLETLRPLTEAAQELRKRSIAVIDVDDRLSGVLSQLRRVETGYREQREFLVDARSGFADFERTLNAFSTFLDEKVREAWRAHTRDRARQLDPEVLRVLGAIPNYAGSIRRLQALDRLVGELRESLPNEDVCERFEQAADKRNEIWEEMQGEDFSQEVLVFLRQASGGGASIDHFTPVVENWITNHNLRGSFRITMTTGTGR